MKDSFYEKLKPIYHNSLDAIWKRLLRDFSGKVGREGIFKPTIWNESVHEISNDNRE
jgi:hypothetical protein